MDAILPMLGSLGPWGIPIGIALVILAQYLGVKLPALPKKPAPDAPPAPDVPPAPPAPSQTPLLDLLLKMLAERLAKKAVVEKKSVEQVAMELVESHAPKV